MLNSYNESIVCQLVLRTSRHGGSSIRVRVSPKVRRGRDLPCSSRRRIVQDCEQLLLDMRRWCINDLERERVGFLVRLDSPLSEAT
jgi:hypothetical protein